MDLNGMACTGWHRAKRKKKPSLGSTRSTSISPLSSNRPFPTNAARWQLHAQQPTSSSSISSFLTSPVCALCFSSPTKRGKKKGGGLRHKSLLIDLKLCFETKPSGLESLYFNEKKGRWKSGNTPRNKQPRLRAHISSSLCPWEGVNIQPTIY